MPSAVPNSAAAPDRRPPRLRQNRSSTVNICPIRIRRLFRRSATSSSPTPASRIFAASMTSSPSPSDADSVSTVRILRSGYCSDRMCAACVALW